MFIITRVPRFAAFFCIAFAVETSGAARPGTGLSAAEIRRIILDTLG